MLAIIRDGGVPTLVVILFGLVALGAAALMALRPDGRKLAFLRALTRAVAFASVAGFTGGVAKAIGGCKRLPPEHRADWARFVAFGTGEALSVVVMGATLLALAWFVASIGIRRLPDEG